MSIAPPSDIVLDVAQAADPLRLQAATAKLARMAAGNGADFAATLDTAAAPPAPVVARPLAPVVPDDRPTRVDTRPTSPYQKFEAMVLQNFVETMLPKNDDLFGDAASADACRSMLADQIANQIAKTGKLGIARAIEKAHGTTANAAEAAGSLAAAAAVHARPLADAALLKAGVVGGKGLL